MKALKMYNLIARGRHKWALVPVGKRAYRVYPTWAAARTGVAVMLLEHEKADSITVFVHNRLDQVIRVVTSV